MDKKIHYFLYKSSVWYRQGKDVFWKSFLYTLQIFFTFLIGSQFILTFANLFLSIGEELDMIDYLQSYNWQTLLFIFLLVYMVIMSVRFAEIIENYELDSMVFTWIDIQFEKYNFPQKSNYAAGLKVISHKQQYLNSGAIQEYEITFSPEISHLDLNGEPIYSNIKLPVMVMKNDKIFQKSNLILSKRTLKKYNEFTVIPIVSNDNNSVWISETNQKLELENTYYAHLEMREGKNFSDDMKSCSVICELYPHRNQNGYIEVSIEIVRRIPEFSERKKFSIYKPAF